MLQFALNQSRYSPWTRRQPWDENHVPRFGFLASFFTRTRLRTATLSKELADAAITRAPITRMRAARRAMGAQTAGGALAGHYQTVGSRISSRRQVQEGFVLKQSRCAVPLCELSGPQGRKQSAPGRGSGALLQVAVADAPTLPQLPSQCLVTSDARLAPRRCEACPRRALSLQTHRLVTDFTRQNSIRHKNPIM